MAMYLHAWMCLKTNRRRLRIPCAGCRDVFLTSHIAGGSRDMHAAAAEEVVRKVAAHLSGDDSAAVSAQRLRTMT